MTTLFISDLHLCPGRPAITALFLNFLKTTARDAQALYILGDFFDSWIGDDARDAFTDATCAALHELASHGVAIYVMPGNRDFLYGKDFAERSGTTLIPDPTVIDLYGQKTLLVHGDNLCSADKSHQIFRAVVRSPITSGIFLHLPLRLRQKIACGLRNKSTRGNQKKAAYIMDVTQDAVEHMMQQHQVLHLIHGHTHAPKVHSLTLNGQAATRTVLGAWENSGHVLICDATGQRMEWLPA